MQVYHTAKRIRSLRWVTVVFVWQGISILHVLEKIFKTMEITLLMILNYECSFQIYENFYFISYVVSIPKFFFQALFRWNDMMLKFIKLLLWGWNSKPIIHFFSISHKLPCANDISSYFNSLRINKKWIFVMIISNV